MRLLFFIIIFFTLSAFTSNEDWGTFKNTEFEMVHPTHWLVNEKVKGCEVIFALEPQEKGDEIVTFTVSKEKVLNEKEDNIFENYVALNYFEIEQFLGAEFTNKYNDTINTIHMSIAEYTYSKGPDEYLGKVALFIKGTTKYKIVARSSRRNYKANEVLLNHMIKSFKFLI